jgi:hypothetical protein
MVLRFTYIKPATLRNPSSFLPSVQDCINILPVLLQSHAIHFYPRNLLLFLFLRCFTFNLTFSGSILSNTFNNKNKGRQKKKGKEKEKKEERINE